MSRPLEELVNRRPGETVTIYPHTGVAIFQIIRVWIVILICLTGFIFLQNSGSTIVPEKLKGMLRLGMFLLSGGGVLYAAHTFLHYANTFVQFTDDAIIYRRGWIPSHTDTIFWINIKDINTSAAITESLLSSGTIILMVALRTEVTTTKISYLPDHENIASYIRDKLGAVNKDVRQMSYV